MILTVHHSLSRIFNLSALPGALYPAEMRDKMQIPEIVEFQKNNTLASYKTLPSPNISVFPKKQDIINILGTETIIQEIELSHQQLISEYGILSNIAYKYPKHTFDFSAKTVKSENSSNPQKITKWILREYQKEGYIKALLENPQHNTPEMLSAYIGKILSTKKTLIISCNPWFILGCSVSKNGKNIANSCHHPQGVRNTTQYVSGPSSYAIDNHTVIAGIWSDTSGLIGRQLIYIDVNCPGIVVGRLYGEMTDGDSFSARKIIEEKLFPPCASWKKTTNFTVHTNDFNGYQDSNFYIGYRPDRSKSIEINLCAPVCVECGEEHTGNGLSCCTEQYSYYCYNCGKGLYEGDSYYANNRDYCESCYHDNFMLCERCEEAIENDEILNCDGTYYCKYCAEKNGFIKCNDCGKYTQDYYNHENGNVYCERCSSDYYVCDNCGILHDDTTTDNATESNYCDNCNSHLDKCDHCGEYTSNIETDCIDDKEYCENCIDKILPYTCSCGTRLLLPTTCDAICATNNFFEVTI